MTADEGFRERTRAEIALRESEERFRAIFGTARDCVFVKDRTLRYTHVNPAMAALFDSPPAALVGVTDDVLFDAETCVRVREVDLRVLQGRIENEVSTSRVHGLEHVFHTVKVPLRDDGGTVVGICGIARDITELKRAGEELREKEKQIRFFATQSLTAHEAERRRIAAELHDSIASALAFPDGPIRYPHPPYSTSGL